eukprot:1177574-Prorocentrum_minimum.AAC.1
MLVKKIPSLRVIDGREVSPEERDHVEMLFAPSEVMQGPQYVTAPPPPQFVAGMGKVRPSCTVRHTLTDAFQMRGRPPRLRADTKYFWKFRLKETLMP